MTFSMYTFSSLLIISIIIQIAAICAQFITNRTYRGTGLWLSGFITIAAGLGLALITAVTGISATVIVFANFFVITGLFLLYTGIKRFLGKKENVKLYILLVILYTACVAYFSTIDDSIKTRIIIFSVVWALFSFHVSYVLFTKPTPFYRTSSAMLAAVLFFQGLFFSARSVITFIDPPIASFFTPASIQVAMLIVFFIVSNCITFLLIIMINQRLNGEIKEAFDRFELIFHTAPDAAIITEFESGRIVDVNNGFISISGFTKEEALGRTTVELGIFDNLEDRNRIIKEVEKNGRCTNLEIILNKKDGTHKFGIISANPITLNDRPHIISIARDITPRKTTEENLKKAMQEALLNREKAEKANLEKELLLKEVHHRIKNNMNTITSLLTLQSDTVTEPSAVSALKDAESRVRSMMILYDRLYRSESFRETSVPGYLVPLSEEIVNGSHRSAITINRQIDDFLMRSQDLFHLGIIINELFTNIVKYAFTGRDSGIINLTVNNRDNHISVIVEDNGRGFPEGFDIKTSTGFGLQLVTMLTEQLNGVLKLEQAGGSRIIIEFDML